MANEGDIAVRRLADLAVLALIACDDAYRDGAAPGDKLRTNPDSAFREEYFFPTRLADEAGLAWRDAPGAFRGEYEFLDWTIAGKRPTNTVLRG